MLTVPLLGLADEGQPAAGQGGGVQMPNEQQQHNPHPTTQINDV